MSGMLAPSPEALLWPVFSFIAGTLCAHVGWHFRADRPGRLGEAVAALRHWRLSSVLLQALRLFYYIGVPFAALLWGHDALVGQALGLQPLLWPFTQGENSVSVIAANWTNWAHDIGWTFLISAIVWITLAWGLRSYRRALVAAGEANPVTGFAPSAWVSLREAAFLEAHWTFYRNLPLIALGGYWGIWAGLAVVIVEAALNPAWRHSLSDTSQAPAVIARGALAVSSGTIFLITTNLWLVVASHWLIYWSIGTLADAGRAGRREIGPAMS